MYKKIIISLWALVLCIGQADAVKVFDISVFGVVPGGQHLTAKMSKALEKIREKAQGDSIIIRFRAGRYDFYPEGSAQRMYYISNHSEYQGEQ